MILLCIGNQLHKSHPPHYDGWEFIQYPENSLSPDQQEDWVDNLDLTQNYIIYTHSPFIYIIY